MDSKQLVQSTTETLLTKLTVAGTVAVDIDEQGAFRVHVATEDTGLLIGFHGKTLESLQVLLGIIVSKQLNEWVKVYVNVGDYREKREESLMYMAQRAADKAVESGRVVELTRLSPAERRVIHLTLSGDERVTTESIGEGEGRKLLIKPK